MKEGRGTPAQENTTPSSGDQTMGCLIECIKAGVTLLNAKLPPSPRRLASRSARVIGAIGTEPIARDIATVTVACGPKAEASSGRPTAAEVGKPRVSATTELSGGERFSRMRTQ